VRRLRLAFAAIGLIAAAGAWPVHAQPNTDSLLGVWRYQERAEPALHGPLTLTRQGAVWRAEIAGRRAVGKGSGNDLRLSFPNGLGQFRGRLADGGHAIEGFWVQPPGPAGSRQSYATPVTLSISGGAWRGDVRPLPASFTLYLKVFRDADGALVGAFRNPEFNGNGGRSQFLVSRDGRPRASPQ
jgi:hypothetical protein